MHRNKSPPDIHCPCRGLDVQYAPNISNFRTRWCLNLGALGVLHARLLVGVLRPPLGRRDGIDTLDVHSVNLLETAALGLDEEEEDDDSDGGTAASEDEAVEVVDLVGDEAGEEGDEAGRAG